MSKSIKPTSKHPSDTDNLYDISEVCSMLKITSRTLRFYEEKRIIQSTSIPDSSHRHYTKEQLDQIKNVLILRALDIPVKVILELQEKDTDLKSVIQSRRAEIHASIDKKLTELHLLNDALSLLESEKSIFDENILQPTLSEETKKIVTLCSEAIISGDTDTLYTHLSPKMIQYMPKSVFEIVRKDTFTPLGTYISLDYIHVDSVQKSKIYQYVKFSRLGLKITYVIPNTLIEGLWLGYYEPEHMALSPFNT